MLAKLATLLTLHSIKDRCNDVAKERLIIASRSLLFLRDRRGSNDLGLRLHGRLRLRGARLRKDCLERGANRIRFPIRLDPVRLGESLEIFA